MHTHFDIAIALAERRLTEHYERVARERLIASTRQPRRSLLQSLARRIDRPVRRWQGNSFEPQPMPAA